MLPALVTETRFGFSSLAPDIFSRPMRIAPTAPPTTAAIATRKINQPFMRAGSDSRRLESSGDCGGQRRGGADAVVDAHATDGVSQQVQAVKAGQRGVDRAHARGVSQIVLGNP